MSDNHIKFIVEYISKNNVIKISLFTDYHNNLLVSTVNLNNTFIGEIDCSTIKPNYFNKLLHFLDTISKCNNCTNVLYEYKDDNIFINYKFINDNGQILMNINLKKYVLCMKYTKIDLIIPFVKQSY